MPAALRMERESPRGQPLCVLCGELGKTMALLRGLGDSRVLPGTDCFPILGCKTANLKHRKQHNQQLGILHLGSVVVSILYALPLGI